MKVGDRVKIWDADKDDYRPATIVRVYDEETYRIEQYDKKGISRPANDPYNETLIDVRFDGDLSDSKAHFINSIREF